MENEKKGRVKDMWDMIDGGDSGMPCLAAIGENYLGAWPGPPKNKATATRSGTPNLQGRGCGMPMHTGPIVNAFTRPNDNPTG